MVTDSIHLWDTVTEIAKMMEQAMHKPPQIQDLPVIVSGVTYTLLVLEDGTTMTIIDAVV